MAKKKHKNTQKFLLLSFRTLLWLKISDLSFHYSPESKGVGIRNGIVMETLATLGLTQFLQND